MYITGILLLKERYRNLFTHTFFNTQDSCLNNKLRFLSDENKDILITDLWLWSLKGEEINWVHFGILMPTLLLKMEPSTLAWFLYLPGFSQENFYFPKYTLSEIPKPPPSGLWPTAFWWNAFNFICRDHAARWSETRGGHVRMGNTHGGEEVWVAVSLS